MDECDRIKSLIESKDQEVQFLGICLYCQLIDKEIPENKSKFISEYIMGTEIVNDLFVEDEKRRKLSLMIANKYVAEYYSSMNEYGK